MLKFENNGLEFSTSYISDMITNAILTSVDWDILRYDVTNEYLLDVLNSVYIKSKTHIINISDKYYLISRRQLQYFSTEYSSITIDKKIKVIDISEVPDNKPIYRYILHYQGFIKNLHNDIKDKNISDSKLKTIVKTIFCEPDIYDYYEIWKHFCDKDDFIKNCEMYDLQQIIESKL